MGDSLDKTVKSQSLANNTKKSKCHEVSENITFWAQKTYGLGGEIHCIKVELNISIKFITLTKKSFL